MIGFCFSIFFEMHLLFLHTFSMNLLRTSHVHEFQIFFFCTKVNLFVKSAFP